MSGLEGRARLLLRAYPPGYRADRGEEIVATLLEGSPPGRNWPAPREVISVAVAGLRVRAVGNRQQPVRTSLRLTLILAAVLWLVRTLAQLPWLVHLSLLGLTLSLVVGPLIAAAIAAPWVAPRRVTVLLAAACMLALGLAYYHANHHASLVDLVPAVIPPLALAAATAAGPARPPRAWLWLPAGLAAASALYYAHDAVRNPLVSATAGIAGTLIACGIAAATLLWLVTDLRPAVAFLLGWAWILAPAVAFAAVRGTWLGGSYYLALSVPLAVCCVAMTLMRPRVRDDRSAPGGSAGT